MIVAILIVTGLAWGIGETPVPDDQTRGAATVVDEAEREPIDRLAIVWTSGDPDVAHRMVLMYGHAAVRQGWFREVRVIVWGPSARLLAGDNSLQQKLAEMQKDGAVLQACIVCADSYGVTDRLRELGLEVKAMGKPLTELLQTSDVKVVTF